MDTKDGSVDRWVDEPQREVEPADGLPAAESLAVALQVVESLVADLRSAVWRQVAWQSVVWQSVVWQSVVWQRAVYQADLVFRFQDGREVVRRLAALGACLATAKLPV